MKREIICPDCAAELRKEFPVESPYPGEHVKFVDGTARQDFRCDQCYAFIQTGDPCSAFTIWTDRQGFVAREEEYIVPNPENPGV